MNLSVFPALIAGPLITAAAFWVNSIPRGGTLLFGVRVENDWAQSPEGRRLILSFRVQLAALLVASGVLALSPAFLLAPFLLPALGCVAYLFAHARAKPHAVSTLPVRSASLTPDRKAPGWPTLLCLTAVLPLIATGIWLHTHWNMIPDRFPIHWDLQGNPNGWASRTIRGVYGPLILSAAMTLMLSALALLVSRRAPRSRTQRAVVRLLPAVGWMTNLLLCAIAINQASGFHFNIPLLTVAMLIGVGAMSIPVMSAAAESPGDTAPNSGWKLGIVYYNPNDPALLVERRFGVGYTLNFANRVSWLVLAATLVPLIAVAVLKA